HPDTGSYIHAKDKRRHWSCWCLRDVITNQESVKPILMSHKKHGAPPLAENGEKRTPSACQAAKPKEGSGTRFMLKEHVSNLVTQNSRICFGGEKRSWTFLRFCLIQIQIFSNNICAKFKIRKSRGYKEEPGDS
ncbi:hypothetical protein HID58_007578, partial [Brassica napus]